MTYSFRFQKYLERLGTPRIQMARCWDQQWPLPRDKGTRVKESNEVVENISLISPLHQKKSSLLGMIDSDQKPYEARFRQVIIQTSMSQDVKPTRRLLHAGSACARRMQAT